MALLENASELCKIGISDIAAGQCFVGCPMRFHVTEQRLQMLHGFFRQAPVRSNFSAEYRQHRRLSFFGFQLQAIVARDCGRVGDFFFQQRPHAGIGPDHLRWRYRRLEIAADRFTQVSSLFIGNCNLARIAAVLDIGGADQGEIGFVRNRKDDALVGVLEDVRVIVIEQTPGDDMAAFDQTDMVLR